MKRINKVTLFFFFLIVLFGSMLGCETQTYVPLPEAKIQAEIFCPGISIKGWAVYSRNEPKPYVLTQDGKYIHNQNNCVWYSSYSSYNKP